MHAAVDGKLLGVGDHRHSFLAENAEEGGNGAVVGGDHWSAEFIPPE